MLYEGPNLKVSAGVCLMERTKSLCAHLSQIGCVSVTASEKADVISISIRAQQQQSLCNAPGQNLNLAKD